MKALMTAAILVGTLVAGAPAHAATITLNAIDSGWYNESGFHDPLNENYVAGHQQNVDTWRNFFVFNLAGITDTILSATLRLSTFDFESNQASETYTVFDVSTAVALLVAGGSGQVGRYNDLGSGTEFGSRIYSGADDNQDRDISLNAAAVAAIQAAVGQQFALGGAITTINGNPSQYVYGFSGPNGTRQLILETRPQVIPEPATLILVGGGILGMARRARRRNDRNA